MGMFLNPDNSAFQKTLNSEIYVDKTGLIDCTNRVIDTMQAFICNSRPRRFGKSVTANMLTAYYSKGCDSKEMFSDLKISSIDSFEKHLNKYDVIHFDVQWCMMDADSPDNIVDYLNRNLMKELKTEYPDVFSDFVQTTYGIMARIREATGRKFIVIIDEWDAPIRDTKLGQKVQDEYINFLRGMFKGVEPTKFISLAYLTGILPIKKLLSESSLNNFKQYTMLNPGPLAEYVGFTEKEVQTLCRQYDRDFGKVKRWYDGYEMGDYHVYNPNAVVNLMVDGTYQSYWSQTGTFESIRPYINMDFDGLKTAIIEMISGASVEVDTCSFQNDMVSFSDKDDVLTLLIHLGYLAYDQKKKNAFIPNEEIRQEFISATRKKKWNEMVAFEQRSNQLLDATLDMEAEEVADGIEKIHNEYASAIQYNNENSLSSVLTIAYLSSMQYYFKPVRELPTGRGFADFVYIPKREYSSDYPALVIELKWNRDAKTALSQIKERKYPDSLLQYTGEILLVGINYDKKTKAHQCLIEEFTK